MRGKLEINSINIIVTSEEKGKIQIHPDDLPKLRSLSESEFETLKKEVHAAQIEVDLCEEITEILGKTGKVPINPYSGNLESSEIGSVLENLNDEIAKSPYKLQKQFIEYYETTFEYPEMQEFGPGSDGYRKLTQLSENPIFEGSHELAQLMLSLMLNQALLEYHWLQVKRQKEEKKAEIGYIYVIKSKYGFKIGKTKNIQNRSTIFNVKLPFEIEFIITEQVPDYHNIELELHEKYSKVHLNGEWFSLTEGHITEIQELLKERASERRNGT